MLHMFLASGDNEHVWKEKNRVGTMKVQKVQHLQKKIKTFYVHSNPRIWSPLNK